MYLIEYRKYLLDVQQKKERVNTANKCWKECEYQCQISSKDQEKVYVRVINESLIVEDVNTLKDSFDSANTTETKEILLTSSLIAFWTYQLASGLSQGN